MLSHIPHAVVTSGVERPVGFELFGEKLCCFVRSCLRFVLRCGHLQLHSEFMLIKFDTVVDKPPTNSICSNNVTCGPTVLRSWTGASANFLREFMWALGITTRAAGFPIRLMAKPKRQGHNVVSRFARSRLRIVGTDLQNTNYAKGTPLR